MMNIKRIFIVSMVLITLLGIAAVNAAEETSFDNLTADVNEQISIDEDKLNEDGVELNADENPIDDSDDNIIGESFGSVDLNINEKVDTNLFHNSYVASVRNGNELNGIVSISIDGSQCFTKTVTYDDATEIGVYLVLFKDLNLPNTFTGTHKVLVSYLKNGESKATEYTKTAEFTYIPDSDSENNTDTSQIKVTHSTDNKKVDAVKLTLKNVKVKKSAKKLVLTATLKINGKAVKGKKLTFKFNKKTYAAKTNKKGVAKITIKKNVLKKLKVGKNVKYQVNYGNATKRLTAKVKK